MPRIKSRAQGFTQARAPKYTAPANSDLFTLSLHPSKDGRYAIHPRSLADRSQGIVCGYGDLASASPDGGEPLALSLLTSMLQGKGREALVRGEGLALVKPLVVQSDLKQFERITNGNDTWVKIPANSAPRGLGISCYLLTAYLNFQSGHRLAAHLCLQDCRQERWILLRPLPDEASEVQRACVNSTLSKIGHDPMPQQPIFEAVAIASFDSGWSLDEQISAHMAGKALPPLRFRDRMNLNFIFKMPSERAGLLRRSWDFWRDYYGSKECRIAGPITPAVKIFVDRLRQEGEVITIMAR